MSLYSYGAYMSTSTCAIINQSFVSSFASSLFLRTEKRSYTVGINGSTSNTITLTIALPLPAYSLHVKRMRKPTYVC